MNHKRSSLLFLAILFTLSLPVHTIARSEAPSNVLVAYFTMPEPSGVDASSGASRVVREGEIFGNVEFIATMIGEATGGDMFVIETVQTYPTDHDDPTAFANDEKAQNARPELTTQIENLGHYDTIFLGYPNWWGDLPMPVYTFLETTNFSGKTIIPFCPHGGSGFSGTVNTIAQIQPDAQVSEEGFTVSRNDVPTTDTDVAAWLERLGY